MNIVNNYQEQETLRNRIIQRLVASRGKYLSGHEIGTELGISRTAVWKHVEALRREGFRVSSQTNRGYRLDGLPDVISPSAVQAVLKTRCFGKNILHFPILDSTQETASEAARKGAPEGTVVIAEQQRNGRGRRGRTWVSPQGGLWFSLVLRPPLHPQKATIITLAAGVAVAKSIKNLGKLPVMLKWPNDVLVAEKKIAGILGEMVAETDTLHMIILGMGINVNVEKTGLPPELHGTATSLSLELGRKIDRGEFFGNLLENCEVYYDLLLSGGAEPVLKAWRSMPNILGRQVKAETPEGLCLGRAVDIDPQGALLIEDAGGKTSRILAGDIIMVRGEGGRLS